LNLAGSADSGKYPAELSAENRCGRQSLKQRDSRSDDTQVRTCVSSATPFFKRCAAERFLLWLNPAGYLPLSALPARFNWNARFTF